MCCKDSQMFAHSQVQHLTVISCFYLLGCVSQAKTVAFTQLCPEQHIKP